MKSLSALPSHPAGPSGAAPPAPGHDAAGHFTAIVESSDDAIIGKTLDGIVTSWNPAAEQLFGYPAREMIGQPLLRIFPPDRLHEERLILERIRRGERVDHFETVRLHRSGRAVHVSASISPLRNAHGTIVGVSKIARDIGERIETQRRQAELDAIARHFEAIVESSDDAIASKTLGGIVTSWNGAAERMFGYTAAEIVGKPMTLVFPPDRLDEERHILERISRGEKVHHFETVRRHRSGRLLNVSATVSPIRDGAGRIVGASKIARDITERVQAQRTIWMQAHHDTLTQLPNRRLFIDRLRQELKRASRTRRHVALMFIDLDRFKEVNDTLGHEAGDQLLVQVSQRIRDCLRESDCVGRMGGDEFTVLLPDLVDEHETGVVARRLSERLQEPFAIAADRVYISGSIGIAIYPHDGASPDDLIRHADEAMYDCKRSGRNQVRHYTGALHSAAQKRAQLIADLRHALDRGEFELVYQPVVDLRDGHPVKFEALLRWNHPALGLVSPADFIPLAEDGGQIHEIGDWVFRTAARQVQAWRTRYGADLKVAINVSPVQLALAGGPVARWPAALAELGLPGDSLVVEITETAMVDPSEATAAQLRALRQAGMQIAIDDFGTGFSCLAYLQQLDAQYLKIDRSFTQRLSPQPGDLALCEAIVVMAHKLGLKVIAEGVETEVQRELLLAMGCDYAQGYLYAAPQRADAAEARLARHDDAVTPA